MNTEYYEDIMEHIACRFFLSTGCTDGDNCIFPHVSLDNSVPDNICRYFLKGKCVFGKYCRFDHAIMWQVPLEVSIIDQRALPDLYWQNTADYNSADLCSDGEESKYFMLTLQTDLSDSSVIQTQDVPFDSQDSGLCWQEPIHYHLSISANKQNEMAVIFNTLGFNLCFVPCINGQDCLLRDQVATSPAPWGGEENTPRVIEVRLTNHGDQSIMLNQDNDGKKCCICGLVVRTTAEATDDRQFGLLRNCNHPFCLFCIMSWNGISIVEKPRPCYLKLYVRCPVCKTPSREIISSRIWMKDVEKESLITSYKKVFRRSFR